MEMTVIKGKELTQLLVESLWEDRVRRQGGMCNRSSYGRTKKNGKGVVT
jgi:hypothetical protein